MKTKAGALIDPELAAERQLRTGHITGQIACREARYIKLGPGGEWDAVAFREGRLHFGYGAVPHELALTRDPAQIKSFLISIGRPPQHAAEEARQVSDFYGVGSDCLWITFSGDHLWWTFARPQVTWHGPRKGRGERTRECIGGWRSMDLKGNPLRMNTLSTRLTCVANYRRTICGVEKDYVLRRINSVQEPIILEANEARAALRTVTARAIATLHWKQFETLVDLVFLRSGWQRASELGGLQKAVDLVVEQPATGERAAVQVKSRASQSILDECIAEIDSMGDFSRIFFVCHSPSGRLKAPNRQDVTVLAGENFAATVLRLSLQDWVLERVA